MFDPMTLIFRGYGVVSWLPMLGLLECFLAALYFKDYSEKDALRAELDLFLAGIGALPFLLYGAVVLNLWSHGDSVKIPTNIWLWAVFAGVGFYYGAVKFRAEAQRTRDQAALRSLALRPIRRCKLAQVVKLRQFQSNAPGYPEQRLPPY